MATETNGHDNGSGCARTVLLLQGGGALGAYHHGVYEALAEDGIDFDRINAGVSRLSMGAVNVATGEQVYFDNTRETITARHIMASGAAAAELPVHRD